MKRTIAKLIKKYYRPAGILNAIFLVFAIASYIISFISSYSTTFTWVKGEEVNPYIVFNVSFWIFVFLSFISLLVLCVWIFVKSAKPEVRFDSGKAEWSRDLVEIVVRNKESNILINISMEVNHFSLGVGDLKKSLGEGILDTGYPEKVDKTPKRFTFAKVKNGIVFIKFADRMFNDYLQLNSERAIAKYQMIVEFFGQLENEKEIVSLGKYFLLFVHERFTDNGVEVDAIGFDRFELLNNKDEKALLKANIFA